MNVVVVSAGLGRPSTTRLLADEAIRALHRELAGEAADLTVVELRDLARDVTDHLLTGFPSPTLASVFEAVAAADLLVAVTPVFSGSYSGLFKSFFDVLEPGLLRGKVGIIAASGGSARHSLVLDHALRPLLSYLGMVVAPTGVFAATADFGSAGGTGSIRTRLERAVREAVALVGAVPAVVPVTGADLERDFVPFAQLLGR